MNKDWSGIVTDTMCLFIEGILFNIEDCKVIAGECLNDEVVILVEKYYELHGFSKKGE